MLFDPLEETVVDRALLASWREGETFRHGSLIGRIVSLSEEGVTVKYLGEGYETNYEVEMLRQFDHERDTEIIDFNAPVTTPLEEGTVPYVHQITTDNVSKLQDADSERAVDDLLNSLDLS